MGDAPLFGPAVTVYVERNVEICMMCSLFDSVACGTLRHVAVRCGMLLRKGATDDVNATGRLLSSLVLNKTMPVA